MTDPTNVEVKQDVLERNQQLNNEIKQLSQSVTRRKVVNKLLAVIIGLQAGLIVILGLINWNLDADLNNSDIHQTQLICAHLPDQTSYVICNQVGLPIKEPGK